MGRRSSGGRRSYSSVKTAKAPAPAPAAKGGGGVFSNVASSFAEAWVWSTGWAMSNRIMDAVLGPRTFRVENTAAAAPPPSPAADALSSSSSPPPSNPCQIHAMAFQDCINQNGSDISKCQFYVNILNDCRRNGQVAAVETS